MTDHNNSVSTTVENIIQLETVVKRESSEERESTCRYDLCTALRLCQATTSLFYVLDLENNSGSLDITRRLFNSLTECVQRTLARILAIDKNVVRQEDVGELVAACLDTINDIDIFHLHREVLSNFVTYEVWSQEFLEDRSLFPDQFVSVLGHIYEVHLQRRPIWIYRHGVRRLDEMNQNGSIPSEDTQQPDNAAEHYEVAQQLPTTI